MRAGKWEEAIAELNTATRFLESGAFFLGHQQELEQMLQVKSRKVGGSLPVGVLPPLPLASSQNASRTAGEAKHSQPAKMDVEKKLRLALSSLPPSLALQRMRVWQRSGQCWAAVGEAAAAAKVIFSTFAFASYVKQVVDLVRSELEASGVAEEARERLVAGLQNAIQKAAKEKKRENETPAAPTLSAPGRNEMVSSKLAVKVSEGAAMRYVVATEDIKAGEVDNPTGFSW